MSDLYIGNRKIKEVRYGNEIVPLIYKGSQLIYSIYNENQVLFESSTAGTYELDILIDGIYEVYVIGGGTGSGSRNFGMSPARICTLTGSSGAGFIGEIQISKGKYNIIVGNKSNGVGYDGRSSMTINNAGNSSIGDLIISYGGTGGWATNYSDYSTCKGGSVPTINTTIISQTLNTKGNNGVHYDGSGGASGGASVYGGYGKGGDANYDDFANAGTNGYVKIVYKGLGE